MSIDVPVMGAANSMGQVFISSINISRSYSIPLLLLKQQRSIYFRRGKVIFAGVNGIRIIFQLIVSDDIYRLSDDACVIILTRH